MPVRPVLLPGLRRLWRDRETLQLGRAPGRAVVLAGLDEGTRAVLPLLDGTRDAEQLLSDAAAVGCPPARTTALLDLLDEAGALTDAAAPRPVGAVLDRTERDRMSADVAGLALLRGRSASALHGRRRTARVRVVGAGRVGSAVAGLLAVAGVGAVDVEDTGLVRPLDTGPGGPDLADVGRSRGEVARERLARASPSTDLRPGAVHLAVLCPPEGAGGDALHEAAPSGAAHLAVEVRDTLGVVGPLVLPGRTACLHCLELTRADRDPDWPVLSAQLSQPVRAPAAVDVVLAAAVAAAAAGQVLAALDDGGAPDVLSATLELALPGWRWRRRSWPAHPDCGCVRAAG